ncbi:hypothetical protein ACHWQZ_G005872 [Mnemiopsis leidyi]
MLSCSDRTNKRIILYSSKSPGPTVFFDTTDGVFIDEKQAKLLISSGDAELKLTEIPYIIELRFTSLTFFDSIRLCVISGTEARKLIDSGGACVKVLQGDDERASLELEEKLLLGATVAGGTAATAAGVASIPFAMGFTSAGVAAGSTAAGIQAGMGSVVAGSWFAALQSVAATTLIGTAAPVVLAGAALAGTGVCGYALHRSLKNKDKQERVIIYCSRNHGPSHFFDIKEKEFIPKNIAGDRLQRSKCQLKLMDLPYPIEFNISEISFFDTARSIDINDTEAKALVDSGGAVLKTVSSSKNSHS